MQVTLLTLLKAYKTVLAGHGICEAEDYLYYRMLLGLSTAPGQDWWSKLDSFRESNGMYAFTLLGCDSLIVARALLEVGRATKKPYSEPAGLFGAL